MVDIVEESKKLMYEQTKKNGAPAWSLTKISVKKGEGLATKYKVDKRLVVTSLYLAHTIFSKTWKDETQKNHPYLSTKFVKEYLDKWKVSKEEQDIILNSIEAHHNKVPIKSLIAEIVKNAECFKFVTLKGCLIFLHELGGRGIDFEKSMQYVLEKVEQKKKLLTLDECKKEAEENCEEIIKVFSKL